MEYRDLSKRQHTTIFEKPNEESGYTKLCVAILDQATKDAEFLQRAEDKNVNIKTYCRYNYLLNCIDPLKYLRNKNNPARLFLESKGIKTDCVDNWLKSQKKEITCGK